MNYLIYGNSYNLINEEIKKIIKDEKPTTYSLDEASIDEIIDDIGYNSMFDTRKIIILKNFDVLDKQKKEDKEALTKLENYLSSPNESTIIIAISEAKPSSRGPLKNVLSKLQIIATPIITKPYELAKILGEVIKREGYGITPQTLSIFAEKCNSNYDIALNELKKLKSIKGSNKLISEADVINYVSNYNTTDLFGFKDAVISKNITKALAYLDDLESSKMEAIPVVVVLAKEYTMIYNIKLMANSKMTNDEISKELDNMHPFRVKILREFGTKYTIPELEKLILDLCNIDARFVSQDNIGYDEIRRFILEL